MQNLMNFTLSKRLLTFLLFLFISYCNNLFAQENNVLINSGDLLKKGNDLHDKNKFKEAITLYKQIDKSDTNYSDALYELSFSCNSDSQFLAGYEYAMEGLKLYPNLFPKFSMQAANALDDMGKYNDAIKVYSDAISKDPQSYLLYYNRAISFIRLEKPEEAKKDLETCLLINPYHASAHYFIGSLYMQNGNLIPAMLAYKTYLLLAPDGRYLNNSITNLSAIAKVSDDILAFVKTKKPSTDDNFDMLQQILLSKIALDKQYDLKAKLEDPIVRQIQVVDEKLMYKQSDKGFAMQYYVPMYVKLFKEDEFEPMIFSIFSGAQIKVVDSWVKKNKKPIENFAEKAVSYLSEIKNTRVLFQPDRKNATVKYLFENGNYLGKGNYNYVNKKLMLTGAWEFFHSSNGLLKAKGSFNDNYEKIGEWLYYYDNAVMKEKINYINDKENGKSEGWFTNGNRWYSGTYTNGKADGVITNYFFNGLTKKITQYSNDKKNGIEKEYTSKGFLLSTTNYVDDEQNGMAIYYYATGQKESEVSYKKGKSEGTFKSYYENGKINMQGESVNGFKDGLWLTYYKNGNVKEKTTYKDGDITGEYIMYYEDGKMETRGNYTKKKIDGKAENFTEEGKVFSDATYEKGKLREINFYDAKGNVISNTSTRKGAADITFYNKEGIKTAQGYFDKNGDKNGEYTTYYTTGKVDDKTNYKDGLKEGNYVALYPNGQKSLEKFFKNDLENGSSKGFYFNGKKKYDGWIIEDEKQQNIIFYNQKGDVTSKEYYLNGELDGYTDYFNPSKIKETSYKYHNGWLEEIVQYDTLGKVISTNIFDKGKANLLLKHYNGKKYAEGNYDHYMLNGSYNFYYFDGSPISLGFYKNDERDSSFKSFYYGGKPQAEGKYQDGVKVGKWIFYHPNGKISDEDIYVDGKLNGVNKVFNQDGSLQSLFNYKDSEIDGEYIYYGDNNQVALILNYKKGQLKSYTYEDKNGVKVPPILLKGGNGVINSFYKNGTASVQFTFANGDCEGKRKFFFSNGKPYMVGSRVFGFDDSNKKTYYSSGQLYKDENFEIGQKNGLCKSFYPNGKIEKEENYYDDELRGECKYYDELGKLKQTRKYYYDLLLTVK
jgi:uncharacterized protein